MSKNAGNCKLTNKHKTKKVRETQIILILLVSLSISYIFCALILFVKQREEKKLLNIGIQNCVNCIAIADRAKGQRLDKR